MSYDLRIAVKVDGTDIFAIVAEPEYSSPSYNLGGLFRACMDWDYEQGKYYPCSEVIAKIERGVRELQTNKYAYAKYIRYGNVKSETSWALHTLKDLRDCIYEKAEEIPIEHLWMAW